VAVGATAVRQALAAWIAPPAVAGLATVFTAEPRQSRDQDYFSGLPAGTVTGAMAFCAIESQAELRREVGGPTSGVKQVTYAAVVVIRCLSRQPDAENAHADIEGIIEALLARLRASRTLGTVDGTVFQAGEGNGLGSADLHVAFERISALGGGLIGGAEVRLTIQQLPIT